MKIIIITGQTATGKTKLALELAKKIPPPGGGELINFDSRQVYKYLDIITGKDLPPRVSSRADPERAKRVEGEVEGSVWLYDIVTPDQYFSSYDYVQKATAVIKNIIKRGKTPILVGGTYFYLKHLLYGFETRVPPNFILREQLNKKSVEELQKILKELDIQSFNRLNNSDKNNPRRLIRRIEIAKKGTLLIRSVLKRTDLNSEIFIGLKYKDKNKLRQVIGKRVGERLKNGAIEEVKKLLKMGYKPTDPGLKTIGYQQIIKYLNNQLTEKEAIKDWINKEVQYAKRQYTFMKKDKNIKWQELP